MTPHPEPANAFADRLFQALGNGWTKDVGFDRTEFYPTREGPRQSGDGYIAVHDLPGVSGRYIVIAEIPDVDLKNLAPGLVVLGRMVSDLEVGE